MNETLKKKFFELLDKWENETLILSNTDLIMNNKYCLQIIEMGKPIVPIILKELENKPSLLVFVLPLITNENPIKADIKGNIKLMSDAWIEWGKLNYGEEL